MTSGNKPSGYTIVEVMIVLAVSSLMFLVAANFINGKQARASFKTGVTETGSRIQDIIEQVSDGHYTDKNFGCKKIGSGPMSSLSITSTPGSQVIGGASDQGSNSDCVFLGKLAYFKQGVSHDYQIIPLAGARLNDSNQPAITLNQVLPTAIKAHGVAPGSLNLIEDQTVPQNLDVKAVLLLNDQGAPQFKAYAVGFVQGLGSTQSDASNLSYDTGAQSIGMVYARDFNASTVPISNTIQLGFTHGVLICLTDGERSATLTIGGQGNQLTIATKYYNALPGICNGMYQDSSQKIPVGGTV